MPDDWPGPARRRVPRTKIMVADLPVRMVTRWRLLHMLDQARDAAVTVLSAPPGTGKTVLLAEWARQHDRSGISWVSLDSDDHDDCRFWSAVLDALSTNADLPGTSPIRTLAVPAEPATDLAFFAAVVDALDELPRPVTLVLDDVQELGGARSAHGLRALVRARPSGLRLILSGRGDPPVSLARLRMSGEIAEIDAEQLRFTLAEVCSLFAISGATITPDELIRLADEAEGWAVDVRMAVAAAVREGNIGEFLAGHDRALREYLTEEVLAALRTDQRELLYAISGCEEVTPALATVLSGHSHAQGLLHELGGQAVIATRLAGPEPHYRIPTLLRSYLLAELTRRDPVRVDRLHIAAAEWFTAQGQPADALRHATQARDAEQVATLLRGSAVDLFLAGRHDVLRKAFGVLDDRTVAADPLLALWSASLYLEAGQTDAADLRLAHAGASMPAPPEPELRALWQLAVARRAQIAGDAPQIVSTLREVDSELARGNALGGLVELSRETLALIAGDTAGSRKRLTTVLDDATRTGREFVVARCLTTLAELAAIEGDFTGMNKIARTADARLRAMAGGGEIEQATVCLMLAYAALLRAEPAECVRQSARLGDVPGQTLSGRHNLRLIAAALRGAAEFELGDWHTGLRRMRRARTAMGTSTPSPRSAALCAAMEHRGALLLGSTEQAREVVRWSQGVLKHSGELLLMRGRTQFALGRHVSARRMLEPVLSGAVGCALPWTMLDSALLGARIAISDDADGPARRLLDRALDMGESMGVRHPFVFAPYDLVEVLTKRLGRLGARDKFASEVLAQRRRLALPVVPPPLTEREMSVLRLLPTLRSIEEIAEDLTVSPNTVKTHVRGIYAKLNVRRRRDAVAIAISHGLLDHRSSISGIQP
ncbi:LuxR C-terminal-related transcriptional regulator [Amycolatopsis panacis]|uniref:HTH luxR-type domain-containing protein n=1 Tax=Amycolatopsis panacis TaxID=2340917 RepID=A0A419IBG9_9PSEU|nr:LuxR C-terminal-related transcriptional regulator [Amycolatopsis panacis]RJQ92308.1 hypothetical protein D5S19_00600 [Amycolatopsis panacis]